MHLVHLVLLAAAASAASFMARRQWCCGSTVVNIMLKLGAELGYTQSCNIEH